MKWRAQNNNNNKSHVNNSNENFAKYEYKCWGRLSMGTVIQIPSANQHRQEQNAFAAI